MERIWQRKYVKGVPSSIGFEDITLPQALARSVSRYPETDALIFEGTELTFAELHDAVSRFSAALSSLGVKPGDRVSIILPNLIQTAVAIYGALHAGAVVVMHNPRRMLPKRKWKRRQLMSATVHFSRWNGTSGH